MSYELPAPAEIPIDHAELVMHAYTADQVLAAYRQGIEDAAKVAEQCPLESFCTESHLRNTKQNRLQITAAIRALSEGK